MTCTHHWIVEGESVLVDGEPRLSGQCRKCRKKRAFVARPTENFNLRTALQGPAVITVGELERRDIRMADER
jgi:hypothetical protein